MEASYSKFAKCPEKSIYVGVCSSLEFVTCNQGQIGEKTGIFTYAKCLKFDKS